MRSGYLCLWLCMRGIALPPLGVIGVFGNIWNLPTQMDRDGFFSARLFGIGLFLMGVLFLYGLHFVCGVIVRLCVGSCLATPHTSGQMHSDDCLCSQ